MVASTPMETHPAIFAIFPKNFNLPNSFDSLITVPIFSIPDLIGSVILPISLLILLTGTFPILKLAILSITEWWSVLRKLLKLPRFHLLPRLLYQLQFLEAAYFFIILQAAFKFSLALIPLLPNV